MSSENTDRYLYTFLKLSVKSLVPTVLLISLNCTSLTYNANLYQDGRTLGKGKMENCGTVSLGRSFSSTVSNDTYEINTEQNHSLVASAFVGYGLSNKLDIGLDGFGSFEGGGGRVFLKYGLTDSLSNWGVALMPVLGFAEGTTSKSEGFSSNGAHWASKTSSGAFVVEFAVPISYHFDNQTSIFFGPRSYNYFYNVVHSYKLTGVSQPEEKFIDYMTLYSLPALFIGAKLSRFRTEVSFVPIEGKIIPLVGFGFKLTLNHFFTNRRQYHEQKPFHPRPNRHSAVCRKLRQAIHHSPVVAGRVASILGKNWSDSFRNRSA